MSDSELEAPPLSPEEQLDEDDRLKPEFVRRVLERVEAGDDEGARELVEPLHPADIADLIEAAGPSAPLWWPLCRSWSPATSFPR
jgi:magnesium transporter